MKTLLILSLCLLFFVTLSAQGKYFIRADYGFNHAIVHSNNRALKRDFRSDVHKGFPDTDPFFGLYIGRSLHQNFGIELGVNYQAFRDKYLIERENYAYGSAGGFQKNAFLIFPLNAWYSFEIIKTRLQIVPHLGISLISHLHRDHFRSDITFDNLLSSPSLGIGETDTTAFFTTKPANSIGLLLNSGIRLEYKILKRLGITINGNHSFGLNEVNKSVVLEKRGENERFAGNLTYKGTHYYLTCGLKIYLNGW